MNKSLSVGVSAAAVLTLVCGGNSLAADPQKIGYVNIREVFDNYEKTKELEKHLDQEKEGKQDVRNKQLSEIERLRDELELLSEKGKEEKQKIIDGKINKLREFDLETRTDLMQQRDEMVRELLEEVENAIKDYGEKEGYRLIFSERAVLFGTEGDDLTEKITAVLNKKYKKK